VLPRSNPSTTPPTAAMALRYPNKMLEGDCDYVKFTFYQYTSPFNAEGGGGPTILGGAPGINQYNKSINGLKGTGMTVLMYMPEDINADYGASWSGVNISNVAQGALKSFGGTAGIFKNGGLDAAGIGTAIDGILGAFNTAAGNAMTKGTGAANLLSDALSKANFGSLSVNDIFAATTQQILNPNTEVLYKGPKMRDFSLSFKMAPRDDTEAKKIKQIIHAFKYATLPTYGSAGDKENASFIKVPQIVDVSFMKGTSENPWVSQFKPCAITGFDISQTPDGAWATYTDGSPVATTMKITFQELKMLYADELSEDGATF
jgi:hypothetical protein